MDLSNVTRLDIEADTERDLVALVRSTEKALVQGTDGNAVVRYFPTAAQDEALSTLIAAYISDIRRAARTARKIDRDDAEMVALEKFIHLVRATDRTNERLAGYVSRAMVNAVMDADAEDTAIRIPPDTLRRYFNLVKEHGSVDAAYEVCKATSNNFDPVTLLAVHRALNAESVEGYQDGVRGSYEHADEAMSLDMGSSSAVVQRQPSPEEAIVQADLVRWLFTKVPDAQEVILRLAYGFVDTRSENLRLKGGYQWDSLLSDAQIAPVVAASRAKVQRERTGALRVMAAAIQSAVDDES